MTLTIVELARLVRDLRTEQKACGTGYKPGPSATKAKSLEKIVDAQLEYILRDYREES